MKYGGNPIFHGWLAAFTIVLALAATGVNVLWRGSDTPARVGSPLGVLSATLFVAAIVVRALPSQLLRLLLCGSLACASASIALVLGFPQSGDSSARTLSVLTSALILIVSTVALLSARPTDER
jgi:hypothetical protein